jgi:glycosyltransferase involved in cell wall biosynthesis
MRISVILCTYNRSQSLAKALTSVAASQLPQSVEWEVLVVDNNSNDHTREVVEDFCQRYPGYFRYLFEPLPGKSHALNAGIQQAHADILAFMDDDVTVEPTWLQNLTAPLTNGEWTGTGGRILPEQNISLPRWLPRDVSYAAGPLVCFDRGLQAESLAEPPFGTNMAFQKKMFEKYGGFRTDLGLRPGSELRGEDTEFGRRLLDAGERLRYEPSAVVYHSVQPHRIQKKYILDWWFDKARADIRTFGFRPGTRWFAGPIPLYLFRKLAVWTLRWMVAVEPARRFYCKLNVWTAAGGVLECYRQSRDAKLAREKCGIST